MTDNRRPVGAAVPRPRPAGGVMGYVAELQQLDTTPTPPRSDSGSASAGQIPAGRTPADPVTVEFIAVDTAVPDVAPGSVAPPATTDPVVAAFEGGLAATATATDDATAEFLLGWVHENPHTAPDRSARGRRGVPWNRRPGTAAPLARSPRPAVPVVRSEPSRAVVARTDPFRAAAERMPPTLVYRSPAPVDFASPARAAQVPAGPAGGGPSRPPSALVRAPQVPTPALVPYPVRVRPLRTSVALDRIDHPSRAAGGQGGTHVPSGAGWRRRLRPAVLSMAAVAVAIAAGVAYGAYDPAPTRTVVLPPPRLQVPTPGTGSGFSTGAVPGVQPIPSGAPGSGSAGSSRPGGRALPGTVTLPGSARPGTGGREPGPAGPGVVGPGSGGPGSGVGGPGSGGPGSDGPGPADPGTTDPGTTDPGTTDPGWPGPPTEPVATRTSLPTRPAPVPPAPPPVPAAPLRATFSRTADVGPLGLTGYIGTVRITNPGGVDVAGWQVRISVPGGNEVSDVDGAEAAQDGSRVTFTPTAATRTVAAGESVTFSFTVYGVLAGEPTDCSIDERPCY